MHIRCYQNTYVMEKLSFKLGFTFFGFAQTTMHDFQNTVLNS